MKKSCKFFTGYRVSTSLVCLFFFLISCSGKDETLFTTLDPQDTGITFSNPVIPNDSLNILDYPLFYNGSGVAIGDINNDGYSDIYLSGNAKSGRLYLNKGRMKFKDITKQAGLETRRWISGVSMVDINRDGFMDIYLSAASPSWAPASMRRNLLFINNGDTTFTEKAKEYGLDDSGFTTHALFLDYDRDGLLDVFLLNHSPEDFVRDLSAGISSPRYFKIPEPHDKLFKNNGDGTFTDVSEEAGILKSIGFGLGAVVGDFNNDMWPDIYVSNDLTPDDVLYINNGDGTFSNKLDEYFKHISYAGMGVDAADFNNDGWTDLVQADMMPKSFIDRKVMSGGIGYRYFYELRKAGFGYRYSQNSLQLNNGYDQKGNYKYSEIARLDNVAYTNWSWSALFGDFNNSGRKDILITNGYNKAVNNYDFLNSLGNARRFGTPEIKRQRREKLLKELHGVKPVNYFFRNEGDIHFTDVSRSWGLRDSTFSYGAAYGDLNNDGRLDVVISNINRPATVLKNTASGNTDNHFLSLTLHGDSLNPQGIGAKIVVTTGGTSQYHYHTLWRGYQSTVDGKIHFGLGEYETVDSLKIIWPDEKRQILSTLPVDTMLHLYHEDAAVNEKRVPRPWNQKKRFEEITEKAGLSYVHKEDALNDFSIQPLLPHQLSMLGPPLAAGDINNDGYDDIYVGGSRGYKGTLFIQDKKGIFRKADKNQPWLADKNREDWGTLFFDANNDNHLDLYVATGQYQYPRNPQDLQDRLYINQGNGEFVENSDALPGMPASTSCVKAGDYDGDGDMDLFVGGRLVSGKYPYPARSYILRNDEGTFTDVTEKVAPELVRPGMITDAVWVDYNRDGELDIITAGVWLAVQFYKNKGGNFKLDDRANPTNETGWWYSLEKGDFNNDGYTDLIAGNLGLNATFKTSEKERFGVFAKDFDNNSIVDIIFTVQKGDKQIPFYGKAKLNTAFQDLNIRFPTYRSIAAKSLREIFGRSALENTVHYHADTFKSQYFQNNKDGTFEVTTLPSQAQISPVMGSVAHDVDQDGNLDVILAGNLYRTEPETPRLDAGNGLWLKGDGRGNLTPVSPHKSGFLAPYDVKGLKIITVPQGKAVVVANNSEKIQLFKIN